MTNQTTTLESEISASKDEISQLEEQESRLRNDVPIPLYAGDPQRFSVDTHSAAQALIVAEPQLAWLKTAIAALQSDLGVKESALSELQKRAAYQGRLQRLEQGRVEIRSKIKQVEAIA